MSAITAQQAQHAAFLYQQAQQAQQAQQYATGYTAAGQDSNAAAWAAYYQQQQYQQYYTQQQQQPSQQQQQQQHVPPPPDGNIYAYPGYYYDYTTAQYYPLPAGGIQAHIAGASTPSPAPTPTSTPAPAPAPTPTPAVQQTTADGRPLPPPPPPLAIAQFHAQQQQQQQQQPPPPQQYSYNYSQYPSTWGYPQQPPPQQAQPQLQPPQQQQTTSSPTHKAPSPHPSRAGMISHPSELDQKRAVAQAKAAELALKSQQRSQSLQQQFPYQTKQQYMQQQQQQLQQQQQHQQQQQAQQQSQSQQSSKPSDDELIQPVPSDVVWPEPLVLWVERSLASCPTHLRTETEAYLTRRMPRAYHSGDMYVIDWNKEPLAHISMSKEKYSYLTTPSTNNSNKEEEEYIDLRSPEKKAGKRKFQITFAKDEEEDGTPNSNKKLKKPNKKLTKKQMKAQARQAKKAEQQAQWDMVETGKRSERSQRFENTVKRANDDAPSRHAIRYDLFTITDDDTPDVVLDWSELKIVGTCTTLEKKYLRLTSAPDPATVRPEPILQKAYDMIVDKWKTIHDYKYTCEQFKSIRQDATVQQLRNSFVCCVYETHARIALEVGDFSEYNQCQTQLKQMYHDDVSLRKNYIEFVAYHILYCVLTKNYSALNSLLLELSPETRKADAVVHAQAVRAAMLLNNYHALVQLYKTVPNCGNHFLSKMLPSVRYKAISVMARAYKPGKLDIDFIQQELGFEQTDMCLLYVEAVGGVVNEEQTLLLTAETTIREPDEEILAKIEETQDHGVTHAVL